jgi:putative restriction endonuclease
MRRMLLAGHIKPWRDSTPPERLDTRNGLAACPAHDVAFDTGLLTVADDLTVLIGDTLARSVLEDEMTRHYYGQPPHARLAPPPGGGPAAAAEVPGLAPPLRLQVSRAAAPSRQR